MKTKNVTEKNMKVCLVGSSGGHLTHLYMLKPFWKDKNRFWVTFDDGSTDETGKMISEWKKSSEFEIKYIYQTNQGKHIAMKRAFEQ